MVSFKIFSLVFIYVSIDEVTCGRISRIGNKENVNIQDLHHIKTRSAFVKPLKHFIGHIAHHLGIHPRHPDYEEGHFHHRGSMLDHNSHLGHKFHDFSPHRDPNLYYGHPSRFPDERNHGFDFQPSRPYPEPDFHHPKFHNHGFPKDIPDRKHESPVEDSHKNVKTDRPAVYPPFHEDDNDDDDPISDFDRNKGDKKEEKPKVHEEGTVNLESGSSGSGRDRGNGSGDWVYPDEEEDRKGGGVIPSTSQIDIRFRKD